MQQQQQSVIWMLNILQCVCKEEWRVHRRCKQPIKRESSPTSLKRANLVSLCKCIYVRLIEAASSFRVGQNTNLSDCLGCC